MLILGIDTSTKICTCCVFDTEKGMIAETSLSVEKNHSNIVMPIIDNLFKISNLDIKNIDKIAVAIGPGSFTGVRIALGIAKGLAMGINKPLIAVNELDILEEIGRKFNYDFVISLIDARKERVYYKFKNKYEDIYLVDLLNDLDKNKKYLFVGDGALNYEYLLKENFGEEFSNNFVVLQKFHNFPRASILCELAQNKEESNIYTLEPEYISKSRAEKQKK